MADEAKNEGGCLCGAVRYRVSGQPNWSAFCHCRSCRQATGSAVAAYASFPAERFSVLAGEPSHFASSEGVRRGFCGRCGAPLTFEGARWPGEIHIHLGSLDDPEVFPPTQQGFTREQLSWLQVSSSGEDG